MPKSVAADQTDYCCDLHLRLVGLTLKQLLGRTKPVWK
jgi:hypothetical protein